MNFIRNTFGVKIKSNKNRIYYLDFLRGILILLVLYHHSVAPLHETILQFHMPALFILSGYTEYILNKSKSFLNYLKSKFYRLIIPYFCFEIINLIIYLIPQCLNRDISLSFQDAFISIITCINNSYIGLYGRLWFIPAIFVSSIFAYLIKKCHLQE